MSHAAARRRGDPRRACWPSAGSSTRRRRSARSWRRPATGRRTRLDPAARRASTGATRTASVYLPVVRDNVPEVAGAVRLRRPEPGRPASGRRRPCPAQALYLMNSPFVMQQAEAAAERLLDEATGRRRADPRRRTCRLFGRPPTADGAKPRPSVPGRLRGSSSPTDEPSHAGDAAASALGGVLPGAVRQRRVPVPSTDRRRSTDGPIRSHDRDRLACSPAATLLQDRRLRLRLPGLRRPRRTQAAARDADGRPARARSRRTSRRGPSGSSSCAWTAGRRTSTRSTTSRKLAADDGKPIGQRPACPARKLLGSPWKFTPARQERPVDLASCSPRWPSTPTTCASLNSMHTDLPNHPQAFLQMHTGSFQFPRPSLGAWVAVRPGHREREPARLRHDQPAGRQRRRRRTTAASFLPAVYQGTRDRQRRAAPVGEAPRSATSPTRSRSRDAQRAAARPRPGAQPRPRWSRDEVNPERRRA